MSNHDAGAECSPLVSVIIPNHNGERFIAASIESVRAQTYSRLEIIVVDDGSEDGSVDIVRRFAASDDRIQLVTQTNGGVAAARNAGIAKATGEFIAPLDSDDVWLPDKIEKQVDKMRASGPDVGLVYAWSATIDADGNYMGGVNASQLDDFVFADLLFGNFIGNGSAPLIRRSSLNEVGNYDETFARQGATGCEDRDLYLRIAERYRFAVVRNVLIGYRHHENNMSGDAGTMYRSHKLVVQRLRERHNMPGRYLRRSSAFNALYLESIEARKRRFAASAGNMLRAVIHDPGLMLEPGFYVLVRLRLVQFLRHHFPSLRGRRRKRRRNADTVKPLGLDSIEQSATNGHASWVESRKRRNAQSARQWIVMNLPAFEQVRT